MFQLSLRLAPGCQPARPERNVLTPPSSRSPFALRQHTPPPPICWNRAGDVDDGDDDDDAEGQTVLLLFLMSRLMNGTSSLMFQHLCCLGNETKTKHFVQDALAPPLLDRRFL